MGTFNKTKREKDNVRLVGGFCLRCTYYCSNEPYVKVCFLNIQMSLLVVLQQFFLVFLTPHHNKQPENSWLKNKKNPSALTRTVNNTDPRKSVKRFLTAVVLLNDSFNCMASYNEWCEWDVARRKVKSCYLLPSLYLRMVIRTPQKYNYVWCGSKCSHSSESTSTRSFKISCLYCCSASTVICCNDEPRHSVTGIEHCIGSVRLEKLSSAHSCSYGYSYNFSSCL